MKTLRFVLSFTAVTLVAACSKKNDHAGHDHSAHATSSSSPKHEHKAPHGGTAVVLGKEAYHLELVRDAATGRLTAYVLDGEMENFIRIYAASFEVVINGGTVPRTLTFKSVANTATGEMVGDSSQFEAQADWLKTTATFAATLTSLEINGTTFSAVVFNFPKGNDKD